MARQSVDKTRRNAASTAKKDHPRPHVNISSTGAASTTANEILQTSSARRQLRAGRKIAQDLKIIKGG